LENNISKSSQYTPEMWAKKLNQKQRTNAALAIKENNTI